MLTESFDDIGSRALGVFGLGKETPDGVNFGMSGALVARALNPDGASKP